MPPAAARPTAATVPALLDRLVREDASRPLLTFYDLGTDERVELSVATTDNWVAKTANLLQDSLGVQAGARVTVDLPVHWQAVVWALACWRVGCVLVAPGEAVPAPDVAVVRVDAAATALAAGAGEVVTLALLPMGARSPGPATAGALDYDAEVLGHGDRFVPNDPPAPDSLAVEAGGSTTSHTALLQALGTRARPASPRLLVTDPLLVADAWPAWLAALAAGGSLVLVAGADDPSAAERLGGLVADEQVTARA